MNRTDIKIGRQVISNIEFSGVPVHTKAFIIEDYGTGIMVAWQLDHRPIPINKTAAEIANMAAVCSDCPLRDGFDKERDLIYLDVVEDGATLEEYQQNMRRIA